MAELVGGVGGVVGGEERRHIPELHPASPDKTFLQRTH